ncbi:right-handed parallel beta-helix repeat-containing protein, partial [Kribbia dieselivorans]|uniref:right-handed parallel beta-helix repeat-containing protein n=1 Tax=Kribbia dieselivorans TaxID=331526 RepID=UPI0012EE6477
GIANAADEKQALLTADLDVRGNILGCRYRGIALAGQVVHLAGNRVVDNEVYLAAEVGLRLLGTVAPGQVVTVAGTTVAGAGAGIEVGGGGYDVTGNTVTGPKEPVDFRPDGLAVLPPTGVKVRGHTRVTANRVRDIGGAGITVGAPLTGLDIARNTVERAQVGIVVTGRARSAAAQISGNTVSDVGAREGDQQRAVGIQVVGAARAEVESNVVRGVGQSPGLEGGALGIWVHSCPEVRVAGNSVDEVGSPEVAKGDRGIAVEGLVDRVLVGSNHIRRMADGVNEGVGEWIGLLVDAGATKQASNVGGYVTAVGVTAAVTVGTQAAYAAAGRGRTVTVEGNIVEGGLSPEPVVDLAATGTVIVNDNHALKNTDLDGRAALQVEARSVTVNGNRAAGGRPAAIALEVDPERAAVLGNLVNTEMIELAGQPLGGPWVRLNVYNVF